MPDKLIRVEIDRRIWQHGSRVHGAGPSLLLQYRQVGDRLKRRQCCLGIVMSAFGVEDRLLENMPTPACVLQKSFSDRRLRPMLEKLAGRRCDEDGNLTYEGTSSADDHPVGMMIEANDNIRKTGSIEEWTRQEREREIKAQGRRLGLRLVFTH